MREFLDLDNDELYGELLWDDRKRIPEEIGKFFTFYYSDDYKV